MSTTQRTRRRVMQSRMAPIPPPTDRRLAAVTLPQAFRGNANTSSSSGHVCPPERPQAGRGHATAGWPRSRKHLILLL